MVLVADTRNTKDKEYVKLNAGKVAPVGTYTGAFGFVVCSEFCQIINEEKLELGERQEKEQLQNEEDKQVPKFYQNIKAHELEFERKLGAKGLKIKVVAGDGNCLFRSLSDQVYGSEDFHALVRESCMNYISLEKEFFSQYIIGGLEAFEDYVTHKRQNAVWGDDLEIQALSEIYELPIEIYAYDNKPMRTFHETSNENTGTRPVQLSYHGRSHFNSVCIILKIDYPTAWSTNSHL